MALAKGHSKIRCGTLSDRTKTAIYVVEQLTNVCLILKHTYLIFFCLLLKVKFKITEIPSSETNDELNSSASQTSNSTTIIECEGLGYQRQF
jgi:hypothetical protein